MRKKLRVKTNKILIIVVAILLGCLILGIGGILLMNYSKQKTYEEKISLGDKYLKEMDYENAILVYSDAISIYPKKSQGYISLSEVYVKNGDYESAKIVLSSAPVSSMSEEEKAKVGKKTESVKTIEEEAKKKAEEEAKKKAEEEAQKKAEREQDLLNILNSTVYIDTTKYCYADLQDIYVCTDEAKPTEYWYADFKGDGTKGLIAVYQYWSPFSDESHAPDCCQIWYTSDGSNVQQLFEWENTTGNSFCNMLKSIEYINSEGKTYVVLNTWKRIAMSYEEVMIFGADSAGSITQISGISGKVEYSDSVLKITEITKDYDFGKDSADITEETYDAEILNGEVVRKD